MKRYHLFDKTSVILGILFFLFSFFYFLNDTGMLFDSLLAGAISGGLLWATYIILRICVLAYKK
ncbi:MAG: hypothetical protein H7A37_04565 [Chlamydiales bacterium]|nr:hypothetical protein [Chlamydiia bacterium]MCP5507555.1 hypothetical protein [Chlamydiales bacterium]